eukprot:TRINITY_DN82985_c0_g1_i1.p1 TRINITY_DN82985_c0_g1~~TRINITY_DN82985_c0_g1_i1.p1  ORF type:complete len:170 (-),score=11.15 TRINITY_DN82985_c0_g1_i1:25-534(-)
MLLWAGPVIMVGIGLLIFALIVVNRSRAGVTEGSEGEVTDADIDNTVEVLDDAKEVDDQKPEAEMIAEDTTNSESVPETKENLKNEEQNQRVKTRYFQCLWDFGKYFQSSPFWPRALLFGQRYSYQKNINRSFAQMRGPKLIRRFIKIIIASWSRHSFAVRSTRMNWTV